MRTKESAKGTFECCVKFSESRKDEKVRGISIDAIIFSKIDLVLKRKPHTTFGHPPQTATVGEKEGKLKKNLHAGWEE